MGVTSSVTSGFLEVTEVTAVYTIMRQRIETSKQWGVKLMASNMFKSILQDSKEPTRSIRIINEILFDPRPDLPGNDLWRPVLEIAWQKAADEDSAFQKAEKEGAPFESGRVCANETYDWLLLLRLNEAVLDLKKNRLKLNLDKEFFKHWESNNSSTAADVMNSLNRERVKTLMKSIFRQAEIRILNKKALEQMGRGANNDKVLRRDRS